MLAAPDGSALGMQAMLPFFQVLPFADILFCDFVFPGIALVCVNGIPNLIAAALLLAKRKAGLVCGGLFGVTLMLWICIQFVIFEFNFMSTSYFLFGACQAITGYAACVFYRQEHFAFSPADYPNIGNNPRELVVYFSRMGYTRKIAYETANRSGAALFELQTEEKTAGTSGFWWCGFFALRRLPMPVVLPKTPLADYDKVTICTPVWVFSPCAPVRAFCEAARAKIRRADYVLLHFQSLRYRSVAAQMDALLGLTRESLRSIRCRMGKFKEMK